MYVCFANPSLLFRCSGYQRTNHNHHFRQQVREYNADAQDLINRVLESGEIYADKLGMVHAPNLANGRMVLLGDAGYCPTALCGMGASLSIYGAKALAHFIRQSPEDLSLSLKNFNSLLQPITTRFQDNARKNAESFLPNSEANLQLFESTYCKAPESGLHKKLTDQLILTDDQLRFNVGI